MRKWTYALMLPILCLLPLQSNAQCQGTNVISCSEPSPIREEQASEPPTTSRPTTRVYARTFYYGDDLDLCGSYFRAQEANEKEEVKREILGRDLTKDDWRWQLGVENSFPIVEMNKCELFAALGKREPVSTTRSTLGTHEMFHYESRTIFVDDGIVTSIHE